MDVGGEKQNRSKLTDNGADDAEEEARDELEPFAECLEGESERVDVGNVVGDDRHGKNDEEESTETSHRTDEGFSDETSETFSVVGSFPRGFGFEGGHSESTEAFEEDHGNVESDVG